MMKSICGLGALMIALAISQNASADGTQSFCDKHSGKFTIKLASCSVDASTGNSPTAPATGQGGRPGRQPGANNPGNLHGGPQNGPTPG